ncbi:MAG: ABC transporter permease [candidate division KSB1 bacterium]|nr:ABC transporter permease [candidate division KSB1 bacterium]MDZ7335087.1 ABC transporter permease [candidate division KSB1 bacterium]MDZ7356244.1 ABC transporter permease [candidate division KSB1 bacterium]MDZ7375770.1 ABC transporter permease [candidate division KSB1 bacterium]MDZ7400049.1 ABC transporter permease [candidate division KSB1 bacterium]
MLTKKVMPIIGREFLTRARTKGFIIGTLIFPLMLILIFGGIFLFSVLFKPASRTYYVVDQTGKIFEELVRQLPDTLKNGQLKYQFIKQDVPASQLDQAMANYQKLVMENKIDGYLIIPEDIVQSREVRYSAKSVSDFEQQSDFERALSRIVTNIRLENIGLSSEVIRREMAQGNVRLVSRQITESGEIEKSGVSSFVLTYFLTYIMFLMIIIYGAMLMRSVIEEKSQRITETIISSVKPVELMVGKIIGICGLGLVQLILMGLIILAIVHFGESLFVKMGVNIPELFRVLKQIHFSPAVFIFMVLFFLLGFIFYSTLFAAVGAMVTTEDEGQQYQMPLAFLIMISYFIMFSVAKNPETPMALWTSLIPFFTPLLMFTRIAVSDPVFPSGAIVSIVTMILSIGIMVWLVAKIYRVGILMYGKKASIKEAIKWIQY